MTQDRGLDATRLTRKRYRTRGRGRSSYSHSRGRSESHRGWGPVVCGALDCWWQTAPTGAANLITWGQVRCTMRVGRGIWTIRWISRGLFRTNGSTVCIAIVIAATAVVDTTTERDLLFTGIRVDRMQTYIILSCAVNTGVARVGRQSGFSIRWR